MQRASAIALWEQLESLRYHLDDDDGGEGWNLPPFNVRLDAIDPDTEEARDYRVRVVAAAPGIGAEWYGEVVEAAQNLAQDTEASTRGHRSSSR